MIKEHLVKKITRLGKHFFFFISFLRPKMLRVLFFPLPHPLSFPYSSVGKEPACNAGDLGLIPVEKEMATDSSILAWRISWTEKPGRLQSMGSQVSDTT